MKQEEKLINQMEISLLYFFNLNILFNNIYKYIILLNNLKIKLKYKITE